MATSSGIVAMSLVANDLGAAALLPLGIGALYLAGAVHGSRAADACRAEIDEFESSLAARDTLRLNAPEPPQPRPAVVDAQPQPPIPVAVQPPPPPPPQQAPAPPPPKPAAKPAPKPKQDDDWRDFWREVE
jgi:outer membrane biosynthesis protein TonB